MIRLALEVPTTYLPEWSPKVDFDFVLAHQVLAVPAYASFFANRPLTREVLMDNSMHELGHAMLAGDLLRAARAINADTVIAPDRLGEPGWNAESFQSTFDYMGAEFHIGAVMSGRTPSERASYLRAVRQASMLLLPYREDRLSWFREQEEYITSVWKRIHLLGVNELSELKNFNYLSTQHRDIDFSVDTAKPIKQGVVGRRIDDGQSLRFAKLKSYDLLNLDGLTSEQTTAVELNIDLLKAACA